MSDRWTADDMYALGTHHAKVEAQGDLEATMATLVGDPVYEFLPLGLRMSGRENVRRYYEHLLGKFVPHSRRYELIELQLRILELTELVLLEHDTLRSQSHPRSLHLQHIVEWRRLR